MFLQILTVISFVLLNGTTGVPVRQKRSTQDAPWINPCVSNGASSGQNLPPGIAPPPTPPPPSVKELIESFRYRIADAASKSEKLRQEIFITRLESSLIRANHFDKMHFEGFPLVSDIGVWESSNDTTKVVKADYKSISTILVFLLQVKLDEIEHYNSTVKTYIEDTINDIYNSLCTLHDLLFCLNESIDSHVTSDVMSQEIRDIEVISERNQRDYIIAKDTMYILLALKNSYISILSQL